MKKILIAAAVVGAFAGAAQAQSSVTLYGIADVSVRFDNTSGGNFRSIGSGDLAPTRWGIRGSEDLGGGLKANFNFEQAINSDTGYAAPAGATAAATAIRDGFSRLSVVGLSGNFGNVRAGVDYSPYFRAFSAIDVFGAATLATHVGGKSASFIGGATRMSNAVFYNSPSFSGFSFAAGYGLGEGNVAATKNVGNAYSIGASYVNGPINVQYAHYNSKTSNTVTKKDNVIGASYDLKVVKLAALYSQQKNTGSAIDANTYSLGVSAPIGAFTVRGQFGSFNDKTAANLDAKTFGLGVLYSLSARSTLYANYGRLDNSSVSSYNMTNAQVGNVAVGSNPSAVSMGLRHSF